MKMVSWNVNGLRACLKKGFVGALRGFEADVVCLQETKMNPEQTDAAFFSDEGFICYWNNAERKGYSGTALLTRREPLSVTYGLDGGPDPEGRVITADFGDFYLVNVYTPNARRDLSRLAFRLEWEDRFREYAVSLDAVKPVVICGDLNVAHREIDIKNAKANRGNSGFTDEEREKMTLLLAAGFVDTFRRLYPDRTDVYTWWSQMPGVRERNVGWRIDYFLVSERLAPRIAEATAESAVMGSDHCPVTLTLRV